MEFDADMYRTPCGESGYIIKFEDGETVLIRAYCGYYGSMDWEQSEASCTECEFASRCPLVGQRIDVEQYVCGWEAADEILDGLCAE